MNTDNYNYECDNRPIERCSYYKNKQTIQSNDEQLEKLIKCFAWSIRTYLDDNDDSFVTKFQIEECALIASDRVRTENNYKHRIKDG